MTQVIKKPRRDCPTVKIEATRVWTKPKSNDAKRRLFSVSPCLGVRAKKKHICSRRLKLGVMNLKLKKCRQAFKVKLMPAKSSRMITVFLTYRMLSAISVTLGQPWSETIKWKISEINNPCLNWALFWVVWSHPALSCVRHEPTLCPASAFCFVHQIGTVSSRIIEKSEYSIIGYFERESTFT